MICPYCQKQAPWVSNELVYGKRHGKSYMCYWCKRCDAYVGCHNNTEVPLGTMANKELRNWRMKTHAAIDPLWRNGRNSRDSVYKNLSKHLGYEVHVGQSDIEQCKLIMSSVHELYRNNNS